MPLILLAHPHRSFESIPLLRDNSIPLSQSTLAPSARELMVDLKGTVYTDDHSVRQFYINPKKQRLPLPPALPLEVFFTASLLL